MPHTERGAKAGRCRRGGCANPGVRCGRVGARARGEWRDDQPANETGVDEVPSPGT